MGSYIVRKQITLDADPAEVWDALTNPEKTKKFFFHCRVFSDWKEGSPITFKGRIFLIKKIEMTGRIRKIVPGKLLQYTLANGGAGDGSSSTVTDEIRIVNGKTVLSITDDVGTGEGAQERYERSLKGWDKVLGGLKDLLEQTN